MSGTSSANAAERHARAVWLAWEDDSSIRSRVLAKELGADFHAFTRLADSSAFSWLRYVLAMAQTTWVLLRRRPALVVAQNPSILLAWQTARLKRVLGYDLVIDLHTHFVRPRGVKKLIYDFLHGGSLRDCTAVIVTNEAYRREVQRQTSRPVFVLPDKIPDLDEAPMPDSLRGDHTVLYICTFSEDEPWREVVRAASMVDDGTLIYVSGRSPLSQEEVPPNLRLTGFLPRDEYQGLLQRVDAVMVLTTAENNLVCGGYEAVAAGKPLILSDTTALRTYFRDGTVFTENEAPAIADAIRRARSEKDRLASDMAALRRNLSAEWARRWQAILDEMASWRGGRAVARPIGEARATTDRTDA